MTKAQAARRRIAEINMGDAPLVDFTLNELSTAEQDTKVAAYKSAEALKRKASDIKDKVDAAVNAAIKGGNDDCTKMLDAVLAAIG